MFQISWFSSCVLKVDKRKMSERRWLFVFKWFISSQGRLFLRRRWSETTTRESKDLKRRIMVRTSAVYTAVKWKDAHSPSPRARWPPDQRGTTTTDSSSRPRSTGHFSARLWQKKLEKVRLKVRPRAAQGLRSLLVCRASPSRFYCTRLGRCWMWT